MAMEDEDVKAAAAATNTQAGIKKGGGDLGDNGTCIDRQPDTVMCRAALNQTAGRGSRSGPGAHAASGIRVLKASHEQGGMRGFSCDALGRQTARQISPHWVTRQAISPVASR